MNGNAAHDHDPFNTRRPRVYQLTGAQKLLFHPAALGLRAWFRTWRVHADAASLAALRGSGCARLIVIWHNRSLVLPEVMRRLGDPARIACLISPSRLAAWEAAFFEQLGYRVVRGSTTRRSIPAALELLRELRAGNDAGISPDGPSGPLYDFKPGAAALARKAGAPLLLFNANARAAVRLNTWDRHLVPLPFARIEVKARTVEPGDPLWALPDPEAAAALRRLCLEITRDPFHLPGP